MPDSSERYPIPAGVHRVEEEIRRSRFISTVAFTPSVGDARAFIESMRDQFSDASHNCWAYLIGPPGSTGQLGMSDDGEPHGTAGRPMLTVLQHANVGDVCAVVTRYFGGTLLGKGGLVKAYSGGVQRAIQTMPLAEHVPTVSLVAVIGYHAVTPVQRLLPAYEVAVIDEVYEVDVTLTLELPREHLGEFCDALTEITNGQALLEIEDSGP